MPRPKRPTDVWPIIIRLNVPHAAKRAFEARRDLARMAQAQIGIPAGDKGTRVFLRMYLEQHLGGFSYKRRGQENG